MNYEFPTIRNISDVLPAIEGRDEFVVAEKDGYTVINYNVMMADTFDCNIRRECRGIIFGSKTGDIIRRPFHKFFNVNEREETQDHVVDLSRPHAILDKLGQTFKLKRNRGTGEKYEVRYRFSHADRRQTRNGVGDLRRG